MMAPYPSPQSTMEGSDQLPRVLVGYRVVRFYAIPRGEDFTKPLRGSDTASERTFQSASLQTNICSSIFVWIELKRKVILKSFQELYSDAMGYESPVKSNMVADRTVQVLVLESEYPTCDETMMGYGKEKMVRNSPAQFHTNEGSSSTRLRRKPLRRQHCVDFPLDCGGTHFDEDCAEKDSYVGDHSESSFAPNRYHHRSVVSREVMSIVSCIGGRNISVEDLPLPPSITNSTTTATVGVLTRSIKSQHPDVLVLPYLLHWKSKKYNRGNIVQTLRCLLRHVTRLKSRTKDTSTITHYIRYPVGRSWNRNCPYTIDFQVLATLVWHLMDSITLSGAGNEEGLPGSPHENETMVSK
ncbi:unnamed protein product [Hermetia illucens]|uniref:Uncharacterized protein n=1 Tax=Hermetia illucens TaxID=343691 RepID=A0A7R8V6Q0_HERIL|nr:unnamed protein product [Hermetia illucens]